MTTDTKVDNGVNVQALLDAREALSQTPEGAQFQWRATCNWVNGTHSNSVVEGFYGLGEEQHHRTEFTFNADHPEIFASEDKGATPVEYVLVGLASCLTAGVAAVAQLREIQLRSVSATLEGEEQREDVHTPAPSIAVPSSPAVVELPLALVPRKPLRPQGPRSSGRPSCSRCRSADPLN